MPPKNDPLALKCGLEKPRHHQHRHARPAGASGRQHLAATPERRRAPAALLDGIETLTRRQLQHLGQSMSRTRAHTLNETLRARVGYRVHRGYREEAFDRNDPRKTKSGVLAMITDTKGRLAAAGRADWARQLHVSSLKDGMCSVRKFGEHLHKTHDGGAPEIDALFAKLRYYTNWSCHAQAGDRPFVVTPHNQKEAVRCLQQMLELVLPAFRAD